MKSSLVISGKVLAVYEELETEEAIQTIIARVACMMPLAAVGPRTQSPWVLIECLVLSVFRPFLLCWKVEPRVDCVGQGLCPPSYICSTWVLCDQPHQAQLTSAGEV